MSTPAERIWIVDTYKVDPETGVYYEQQQALTTALLELVGLISRVGGVVQIATRRGEIAPEIAPGRMETLAVVFRWRSFVPADKAQGAPAAEQEVPSPPELPARDDSIPPPAAVA